MKFTPSPSFIFQNKKNQIYKNWGKPIIMSKNEKYFLNSLRYASCHTALSSFQSSRRIAADIRFAPRLGAHLNCSLRSQLLISANVYEILPYFFSYGCCLKMFSTACYRLVFIILCHFIFQFATSFLFVVRWLVQSANVLFFA